VSVICIPVERRRRGGDGFRWTALYRHMPDVAAVSDLALIGRLRLSGLW
jgi:hypothetical protein